MCDYQLLKDRFILFNYRHFRSTVLLKAQIYTVIRQLHKNIVVFTCNFLLNVQFWQDNVTYLPEIIPTSQAHLINKNRNVKGKMLICNSDIYFNAQCILKNLVPTHANNKVSSGSPAAKFTNIKTQPLRIKGS